MQNIQKIAKNEEKRRTGPPIQNFPHREKALLTPVPLPHQPYLPVLISAIIRKEMKHMTKEAAKMKVQVKNPFPIHLSPKTEGYLLNAMNLWNTPLSLWGLSLVSIAEDAEILDIGCGGGINLERLQKKAPKGHVSGIDSSFRAVDYAYRLNEKAIQEGRCSVCEGSADVLPFPNQHFDFILAEETFYFWKDPAACLKEILRVLKPGGRFLILHSKGGSPLHRIYEKLIPGMKVYSKNDLKELLEEAGFRDVTIHSRLGALAVETTKPVTPLYAARKKMHLSSIPYGKLTAAAISAAALGLAAYGASRKYHQ